MVFEIASARFSEPPESAASLKSIIAKLDSWYGWLEKAGNLEAGFSDWFLKQIDQLERLSQAARSGISSFDDGFFMHRPNPIRHGYLLSRFVAEARSQCDFQKEKFGRDSQFFLLGLVVDGAANGCADCDYCRGLRKLSSQRINKKSVWQFKDSIVNPKPNPQFLTTLPRSFVRRVGTSAGEPLFPFDVLKEVAELPPPLQWANAIVDAWSALAKEDQEEAGFRRVELKCGEIYLDGQLRGIIPRDNNSYIALDYIVGMLQHDSNAWFTSRRVYREIYKYHQLNNPKKKRASKTPSGGTEGESPDPSPDQPKRPEYGKLHKMIVEAIGEIFQKIDGLNTRKGFTLRITEFSKAVLA